MTSRKKPKHRLYDTAETLFVEKGMTCAAIAEELPISEVSLSKWRTQMGWDDERQKYLSTPGAIRKLLLAELEHVAGGGKPRIDTDALSKINKALTYFDGKIALPVVITVFKDYDQYNGELYPHEVAREMQKHKDYLHHLAKLESLK